MTMISTLKTTSKAALVAIALGTTAMGAMPAQAAGPGISFSFGVGNGFHPAPGGMHLQFGDKNYFNYCMTNRQIERSLRDYGYRDAQVVREGNKFNKVIAIGRKGNTWYQMRVDRCSGKVDRVTKLNRLGKGKGNGFDITLSF